VYNFSIVPLLPPTPAALVPSGREFADAFFCSAARRLILASWKIRLFREAMQGNGSFERETHLMRVLAPPGGTGEPGLLGVDESEDYTIN
jgi:hypothetical protein